MTEGGSPSGRRRIVVLGCAGTGKTMFARWLAARLDVPAITLDALWRPGWGEADLPAFRALIEAAHSGGAWVSDGNFAVATFDLRLPRADLIVWLERPWWLCVWRVLKRPLGPGEPHRLGDIVKVLGFIAGFDRVNRPRIEALRAAHGPDVPVLRLTTTAETEAFLADPDSNVWSPIQISQRNHRAL